VSLWAHARKPAVDALVLNSPWFDLMGTWLNREVVTHVLDRFGPLRPRLPLRGELPSAYVQSIHRDHHGEWDFNLDWKPLIGPPIYAGWLRAIRRGHADVHRGIEVGAPTLVMSSTRSFGATAYEERCQSCDVVIDVRHTAKWAHSLTRRHRVMIRRFEGGIHDLVLSRSPVREQVFDEMGTWLRTYVD